MQNERSLQEINTTNMEYKHNRQRDYNTFRHILQYAYPTTYGIYLLRETKFRDCENITLTKVCKVLGHKHCTCTLDHRHVWFAPTNPAKIWSWPRPAISTILAMEVCLYCNHACQKYLEYIYDMWAHILLYFQYIINMDLDLYIWLQGRWSL